MTDEEMVAYLARCQLDPAMPRRSIETLLHAFVPAATCTTPIPTRSTCSPGDGDGERLSPECFGDRRGLGAYIRPGFTLAKQVGGGGAAETRGLSSSCSPSTVS